MASPIFTAKQAPLVTSTILTSVYVLMERVPFFVAGGVFRDLFTLGRIQATTDVDVFFKSKEDWARACDILAKSEGCLIKQPGPGGCLYQRNGVLVHLIIKKVYLTIGDLLMDFDFTVCCAAMAFGPVRDLSLNHPVLVHPNYFEHLASRTLYLMPNGAGRTWSIFRLRRYLEKGFKINPENLHEFAARLRAMDEEDFDGCFYDTMMGENQ